MPADYSLLAHVYDPIGLGDYARAIVPKTLEFAMQNGWMGRRVVDIGCGTGASLEWLVKHGYVVSGIDASPQMLQIAKENPNIKSGVRWQEGDIRQLPILDNIDLALAINIMNELDSLRDLETAFGQVKTLLSQQKWFIFDMTTLQGLVANHLQGDKIIYNQGALTIFASSSFDYERQIQTIHYTIFEKAGETWKRSEAQRTLRAYPIGATASLLQRLGFAVKFVLNERYERYDPTQLDVKRVIFMAEKQS